MKVLICPGIHEYGLTQELLASLKSSLDRDSNLINPENLLVFTAPDPYLTLSAVHILNFLRSHQGNPATATPVVFIGFSAGVVGAIGAAWGWQLLGGKVKALIAIDGWGVPLIGDFALHRLSHNFFTHWSSSMLGSGLDNFYADPAVEHLTLWRSPQTVTGWWLGSNEEKLQSQKRMTAAEFLIMLLKRYEKKE